LNFLEVQITGYMEPCAEMTHSLPWLFGEDFNEILDNLELFGARERAEWDMAGLGLRRGY
jgi:hypothetical protein